MMSLKPVSSGQESYYLSEVSQGAEEYYTQGGEVPGRWLGVLAARVSLSGEVDADDLRSVLAGVVPSTGEQIARNNRKVTAIDLTLSAPKSVSLLWALGDSTTAAAVVHAHEHAVEVALGYLEREAVRARRGKAGSEVIDGDGLIAAAFRHRTSRAGDPQLHTHVLVANATYCPDDGAWRALHGKVLYWHARTAGHLYQAELRHALTASLGVEWTSTVKGCAELTGISRGVIEEFSRRRAQVEREMERTGDRSIRAARRAAVVTRPVKDHDIDYGALRVDWKRRADLHGLDVGAVQGMVDPAQLPAQPSAHGDIAVDDDALAAALTERDSFFDRRHAVMLISNHADSRASADDIEERADCFLASAQVEPIGVAITGVQYSTVELLAIERRLLERASEGQSTGACEHVDDAMDAFATLSGEQARMVRSVTTDGAAVSVVVGAAGTGKTHALGVARDLWHAEGFTVIGCALAARAAAGLETSSGIPSCSLDRLLNALDAGRLRLWPDVVVVVDEAAMVGTRKLARLLDYAGPAWSKVVLVGDHHQLPEIGAGGAFAGLARHLGAVTLTENRRQHDPAERAALAELRSGDVTRAVDVLAEGSRIHEHATSAEARDRMVDDWLGAVFDGRDAVMLAATRAEVEDLNGRARARLIAEGGLNGPSVRAGEREFAIGDWVMTTRNDYERGILNGRRGVVTDVDARGRWLIASFDGDSSALIPSQDIEDGTLEHAYAMTVHKAQGITCDVALVLGGENLYREAAYTALSRGRMENHLYVAAPEADLESHLPETDDTALDSVRDALARSRGQVLASINLLDLPRVPVPGARAEKAPERDIGIEL